MNLRLKSVETEIMVAGLEAKGFKKVFVLEIPVNGLHEDDDSENFTVDVWSDDKHINVFFTGIDGVSHYFFQQGDVKAIKRMLKAEDILGNKALKDSSEVKKLLDYFAVPRVKKAHQVFWEKYEVDTVLKKAKIARLRIAKDRKHLEKIQRMLVKRTEKLEKVGDDFKKATGYDGELDTASINAWLSKKKKE